MQRAATWRAALARLVLIPFLPRPVEHAATSGCADASLRPRAKEALIPD